MPSRHSVNVWSKNSVWMNELMKDKEGSISNYNKYQTWDSFQFSHCHVWFFVTLWTAACQASLSITNSWILLKLMPIKLVMPSYYLILCHPLLLLPSIFLSIRVFSSGLALCIKCPKYQSFIFSISPYNEYSWLISFRIDWFEHHSSKASVLWCSAFFMVQLSHLYRTTGKIIVLMAGTIVVRVMSAF